MLAADGSGPDSGFEMRDQPKNGMRRRPAAPIRVVHAAKGIAGLMIEHIDEYFRDGCGRCPRFATDDCSARRWRSGLLALRDVCLEVGLIEILKWAHPCYAHAGRNIAIIGAHRSYFRLSFFDAALLTDPNRVLEKQGPNTAHPDMLRFTDPEQASAQAPIVKAYLLEAMGYAEAGVRPPKAAADASEPDELAEAFAHDPDLAQAWRSLTPGRRRSYVIAIGSAKKSATRRARVEKFRTKILSGKGAMER